MPVLGVHRGESKRNRPGVRIIDIGTRRTMTTDFADEFLGIVPNGDLALANAIAQHIVASDRVDEDFVNSHTVFQKGKENIGYGLVPRRSEFDRFTFRPPPLDRGPRQSIKTTAPGY